MTQPKLRGVLLLMASKLKILTVLPWLYKKKHTNREYFCGWGVTNYKNITPQLYSLICVKLTHILWRNIKKYRLTIDTISQRSWKRERLSS